MHGQISYSAHLPKELNVHVLRFCLEKARIAFLLITFSHRPLRTNFAEQSMKTQGLDRLSALL
jgi:hypothetical protein